MAEPFNAAHWLLGRHAAATPGRVAITAVDAGGTATDLTYGELDALARQAAGALVTAGIPDADGLDQAVACVAARPGTGPADTDLIERRRAGLSSFERPRHVLFLPEFPLTATGKVQRFRLREHAITALRAGGEG